MITKGKTLSGQSVYKVGQLHERLGKLWHIRLTTLRPSSVCIVRRQWNTTDTHSWGIVRAELTDDAEDTTLYNYSSACTHTREILTSMETATQCSLKHTHSKKTVLWLMR